MEDAQAAPGARRLLRRQDHRLAADLTPAGGSIQPQRLREVVKHEAKDTLGYGRRRHSVIEHDQVAQRYAIRVECSVALLEVAEPDEALADVASQDFIYLERHVHVYSLESMIEAAVIAEVIGRTDRVRQNALYEREFGEDGIVPLARVRLGSMESRPRNIGVEQAADEILDLVPGAIGKQLGIVKECVPWHLDDLGRNIAGEPGRRKQPSKQENPVDDRLEMRCADLAVVSAHHPYPGAVRRGAEILEKEVITLARARRGKSPHRSRRTKAEGRDERRKGGNVIQACLVDREPQPCVHRRNVHSGARVRQPLESVRFASFSVCSGIDVGFAV